jgi:predicted AlkP superfamily phosphohydrolase/phosphomutase
MANQLLVIGLDGATFDLLDPLFARGLLPNLARLRRRGVWGRLASTTPPVSVPAWPSFATGRNPGKTGMYDFLVRKPGTYNLSPAPPLRVRPFWESFGRHGLRVGVVNVPGTYPPRPVNGFIVTGMMTPSTDVQFTHPPELAAKLHELTGGYKLDCERGWWEYAGDADFVAEINELIEQRFKVFDHLMRHEPWDFLCLVITETDRFHHRMWKHLDPKHPEADPKFADCFERMYGRLDAGLGELLAQVDEETNVVVMSDHGFGPCEYTFAPNAWLLREGYLKVKRRRRDRVFLNKLSAESLARLLDQLHVKGLVNRLMPRRAKEKALSVLGHESARLNLAHIVDWKQTVAVALPFSNGYGNMTLNLKGREPEGIVEPGREADRLLAEIRRKLEQLNNPLSPTPVRVETHLCKDLYTPDTVLQPPDLILGLDDYGYEIDNGSTQGEPFGRHRQGHHSGSHRTQGILIAAGPDFQGGKEMMGARLLDLAPTFHQLLGVPPAVDFDGRVLSDALTGLVDTAPARAEEQAGATENIYSDEEVALVEQQLRQLGYIE